MPADRTEAGLRDIPPAGGARRRWPRAPVWDRLEVEDPSPLEDRAAFWRLMSQAATVAMFVVVFGALLYFTRPVLLPVLAAVVVGMTIGPLASWAAARGVPAWVSGLITVCGIAAGIYLAILFLSQPVTDLIARWPEVGTAIREKFYWIDRPMAALRELQEAMPGSNRQTVVIGSDSADILGSVVSFATPAVVQFLLFFGTVFFFIQGREAFRRTVVDLFVSRPGRLRALKTLNDIERNLSRYLITVTGINLCVGIVFAAGTWAMGLPTPLLWGAMAFALNYIPYIGAAMMHVTLFFIGLVTFPTLTGALIPAVFSMAVNLIEGQFITPNVLGRRFDVAPLLVFLSVAFWAWMWGPLGAFLAMPVLIAGLVTVKHLYPDDKAALPG